MNGIPENSGRDPDKKNAKQNQKHIGSRLVDGLLWFFNLLDVHNGVVTAIGTLVIAAFTVLATATIELKKLGEQQAADVNSPT